MNEILNSLWFDSTLISIVVMAAIAMYIWLNYGRIAGDSRGFFLCLVAYKIAVCFEELCAYIGSYGISPDCFTTRGLIIRLAGRAVEIIVAAFIFRYLITRQR